MFYNFKKQLLIAALTICCGHVYYAYGYDLLVISDSKDQVIKFWRDKNAFELSQGFAAYFQDVQSGEKLVYSRDSKSFTFGSVAIERNFGDFSLDALTDKDFVVIRFNKETGYVVTIIREKEHNGIDWASRFECEHNKLGGVRYSTSVKKLLGKNGEFDFVFGSTRAFFGFARLALLDIYAGMMKLMDKNFKDINKTSRAINKLNNYKKAKRIMGGKIEFYTFNKYKELAEKLEKKSDNY